jgi:hypothetical protein
VAVRLFAARRGHAWPPVVTARDGWEARYRTQADGLEVVSRLDEAIAWANQFVVDIDAGGGAEVQLIEEWEQALPPEDQAVLGAFAEADHSADLGT